MKIFRIAIVKKQGASAIINKIESFSHQELNTEYFKNKERITERIQNSKDLFDRNENTIFYIPISENDYLPVAYETYLTNYFIKS